MRQPPSVEGHRDHRAGMRADLAVWDVKSPAALSYWSGAPLCAEVWINGVIRYERSEG